MKTLFERLPAQNINKIELLKSNLPFTVIGVIQDLKDNNNFMDLQLRTIILIEEVFFNSERQSLCNLYKFFECDI